MRAKKLEVFIENYIIKAAGISVLVIMALILLFMLKEGLPFITQYSFTDFIAGKKWYPLSDIYGVLPLIYGTLLVTLISALIAIPLSVATAIFIAEIAPMRFKGFLKVCLEILASIPSVVFGFLGIIFAGPVIQSLFGLDSGMNAFTAGLLLAFMSIPTIASVTEESLNAVPRNLREASLALGATYLQTIFKVTLPAAFPGIFAGTMLGIGRAIGETMTVMMVAGGAAQISLNIFKPVRTMTGTIAAEMGEVIYGDVHYSSLFMIGLLLFLITLGINSLSGIVVAKIRSSHGGGNV